MNNDEKILVTIEEVAHQVEEIKKNLGKSNDDVSLKTLISKIEGIEEKIKKAGRSDHLPNSNIDEMHMLLKELKTAFYAERPRVIHKYIEVNKPHWWIVGGASYFIISLALAILLVFNNSNLKQKVRAMQSNDYKYRYLKLEGFEFHRGKNSISNSTELVYLIDVQYNENEEAIKEYVNHREEEIRRAFEAAEIAKQKEAEAKAAREEVERLNRNR